MSEHADQPPGIHYNGWTISAREIFTWGWRVALAIALWWGGSMLTGIEEMAREQAEINDRVLSLEVHRGDDTLRLHRYERRMDRLEYLMTAVLQYGRIPRGQSLLIPQELQQSPSVPPLPDPHLQLSSSVKPGEAAINAGVSP